MYTFFGANELKIFNEIRIKFPRIKSYFNFFRICLIQCRTHPLWSGWCSVWFQGRPACLKKWPIRFLKMPNWTQKSYIFSRCPSFFYPVRCHLPNQAKLTEKSAILLLAGGYELLEHRLRELLRSDHLLLLILSHYYLYSAELTSRLVAARRGFLSCK